MENLKRLLAYLKAIKEKEKEIAEAKLLCEQAVIEAMNKMNQTSITIGDTKITLVPTMTYSLNEEGQAKLNNLPYSCPEWKKSPDMAVIRQNDAFAEFIETKEGKMQVRLKE